MIYRTRRFLWLVFVESYENFKIDWEKLLAPYNCEFIICFPVSDATYKFVEVYKLKNRVFFYESGFFQKNAMSIPDSYLYLRRMDLNGTILEVSSPPEVS